MTLFLPFRKASLLIPTPPHGEHLFVLLTNPVGENAEVLMVSLSSTHRLCDRSCVLVPGDHPFIKHESYIVYARARIETADKLLKGVAGNHFLVKEPFSDDVMAYIVKGLRESRHTAPSILDFFDVAARDNP